MSALLGGLTALAAVLLADYLQRKKENREDKDFNFHVLEAIQTELKTLLEVFDADTSNKLKNLKEGEVFPHWIHFSQKHFIVYETNIIHIGKIDPKLAKQLIKVHELIKVLIENFGINSHYVMDSDQVYWALRQNPNDQNLMARKERAHSLMVGAAKDLKQQSEKIHIEAGKFFQHFDEVKQQRFSK